MEKKWIKCYIKIYLKIKKEEGRKNYVFVRNGGRLE